MAPPTDPDIIQRLDKQIEQGVEIIANLEAIRRLLMELVGQRPPGGD